MCILAGWLRPVRALQESGSERAFISGLLFACGLNPALAQLGPPEMPLFEANAPQIGEPFPDVTIHDDLGNPVNWGTPPPMEGVIPQPD